MAGRPKLRQLTRAVAARGGDDWLFQEIGSGRTLASIARELGFSRSLLGDYCWHPKRAERMKSAQKAAAAAWADDMLEIADAATPEDYRAKQLQIGVRQWLAERKNPAEFSLKAPDIQLNAGSIHVAVLRAVEEASRRGLGLGAAQLPDEVSHPAARLVAPDAEESH